MAFIREFCSEHSCYTPECERQHELARRQDFYNRHPHLNYLSPVPNNKLPAAGPYHSIERGLGLDMENFEIGAHDVSKKKEAPKFKKGDKVVCKVSSFNGEFSENGIYIVASDCFGSVVEIKENNHSSPDWYASYCFRLLGLPEAGQPPYSEGTKKATQETINHLIKDTNPKDAVGIKKAPFSTVSAAVIAEIGVAMLEGARKYGRHNYRISSVRYSVYYDATLRHLTSWWEGQDTDPDSGLSHITKALASLTVLRDAMIHNKVVDDRPPVTPDGWEKNLQAHVDEIFKRYPDAKEAFTEVKDGKK